MTPSRPGRGAGLRLPPGAALALALLAAACGRAPTDDPVLGAIGRALLPGERLVLLRPLDPETDTRFAAVVRTVTGKSELRVYERPAGARGYLLAHSEQQGDRFHNLVLEDVDGDGQEEMIATWTGGHLEVLDVIARGQDGTYRSLFQNAGQEIETRHGPEGAPEFWITSRTYKERPGQAPAYDTVVYRWDGQRFSEAPKRQP